MGFDRTPYPNSAAQAAGWPTARDGSGLPRGHHFRAAKWHSLADAAERTGIRIRHDLLAAFAGLAAGRNLGSDPFRIAELAFTCWPNRLVACCGRQLFGARDFWGLQTGPNPTDRAKRGSKHHLICDGSGIPLAIKMTGANCHDSTQALPLLDGIPPLQGPRCRPR